MARETEDCYSVLKPALESRPSGTFHVISLSGTPRVVPDKDVEHSDSPDVTPTHLSHTRISRTQIHTERGQIITPSERPR